MISTKLQRIMCCCLKCKFLLVYSGSILKFQLTNLVLFLNLDSLQIANIYQFPRSPAEVLEMILPFSFVSISDILCNFSEWAFHTFHIYALSNCSSTSIFLGGLYVCGLSYLKPSHLLDACFIPELNIGINRRSQVFFHIPSRELV